MTREELVPITEARARMNEIVTDVLPERDVILLRHGRPVGVIVAPARFEALIERIENLEDELSVVGARVVGDKGILFDDVERDLVRGA